MAILFDDLKGGETMTATIYSDSISLHIKQESGESAGICIEPEDFFRFCKVYISWYNEEPGFENLEHL